jgi:acyl-CoA thioesterase YciA
MDDTAAPVAEVEETPRGTLAIRTLAMPADTNPSGDIFGGWLMAQMDIAGGVTAEMRARGRVATVAVQGMAFHKPVHVGDVLCCYADILKVGRTSLTILVEAWVLRRRDDRRRRVKVTEGAFTYVAIDGEGRPRSVPIGD